MGEGVAAGSRCDGPCRASEGAQEVQKGNKTAEEPVEGYGERVTEKMQSTLGCIQEFLVGIGKFTSPRIAKAKW